MSVIDLAAAREDRTPHLQGPAECAGCHHEWHAVAPEGTVVLECPQCHAMKGIFTQLVECGRQTWQCNCGCEFFKIEPEGGPYCVNCGVHQTGWF